MSRETADPFHASAMIARYLVVEAALAEAQGALGIIPEQAAAAIASWCVTATVDRAAYDRSLSEHGFPIIGVVQQMVAGVPNGLGQYAHYGATTQDVMDTATMLAIRDALEWIDTRLDELVDKLEALACAYSETPAIGRSQLQHAIPITFGFRVGTWVDPLLRHRRRLLQLREADLVVQLSGAVGTSAALHPRGPEVTAALAKRLGLDTPAIGWHSARDRFVAYVQLLAGMCTSVGKLATDVLLMSQGEVGELAEPGAATSSTMPNKRNPVLSQSILLQARRAREASSAMLEAGLVQHERGAARWQIEWEALPKVTSATYVALSTAARLVDGLEVVTGRMRENLERAGALVHAEELMMALAPALGRQSAHDLVGRLVAESRARNLPFADGVRESQEIRDALDDERLTAAISGDAAHAAAIAATTALIEHLRDSS